MKNKNNLPDQEVSATYEAPPTRFEKVLMWLAEKKCSRLEQIILYVTLIIITIFNAIKIWG